MSIQHNSDNLYPHVPVLLQEVMHWARVGPESVVIDATIGFGGHASAILPIIGSKGKYLGIDKDEKALEQATKRLQKYDDRLQVFCGRFSQIDQAATSFDIVKANLILFDLGVSSPQLDDPEYGLSFVSTGELDMRIGMGSGTIRASDVLNYWSRKDLKALLTEHGQPRTNRLVDRIVMQRQRRHLKTVPQLVDLISEVVPRQNGINPATRVFQALRVVVNDEYGEIENGLAKALSLLAPEGRLIVISFHSGEDAIVKHFMQDYGRGDDAILRILTKKPLTPSKEEMKQNPRCRSAKMRVAERIGELGIRNHELGKKTHSV